MKQRGVKKPQYCGSVKRSDAPVGCGSHFHMCGLTRGHEGECFCWACLLNFWVAIDMPTVAHKAEVDSH